MEKVWSNLRASSALNSKCIIETAQLEIVSFQPLSGEIKRALESIHRPKDIVALYFVKVALCVSKLEAFSLLFGNISMLINFSFITVIFKSHFLP